MLLTLRRSPVQKKRMSVSVFIGVTGSSLSISLQGSPTLVDVAEGKVRQTPRQPDRKRLLGVTSRTPEEMAKYLQENGAKPIKDGRAFICQYGNFLTGVLLEPEVVDLWVSYRMTSSLSVTKTPNEDMALTNQVYLSPKDAVILGGDQQSYVTVGEFIFTMKSAREIPDNNIAMTSLQRRICGLGLAQSIPVSTFVPPTENYHLSGMTIIVDFLMKSSRQASPFEAPQMTDVFLHRFDKQIFTVNQQVVLDFGGTNLLCIVKTCEVVDYNGLLSGSPVTPAPSKRGIFFNQTVIAWEKAQNSQIIVRGGEKEMRSQQLFQPDWNFESMGIGGLDREFSDIFRRAFASRIFPPSIVQKLGINHVRGILLFGPPGTGKTLMARQIGKMLNGKEPKVVNGPKILSKYVGQSEENIRNLFKDAEAEYKQRGDDSDLHIIIFDEIDAICRQRGTRNDGTGVGDTVVNQLLSKIDGVDSLNNILLIGMTNRKDMIDEALLRPGRLEVQMEINLPDEKGRLQILKIHTSKIERNNFMGPDVELPELATMTKNFSGAEIEGLVKSATSFAFNRKVNVDNLTNPTDIENIKVMRGDFMNALSEVKPAFGVNTDEFEGCMQFGIIPWGEDYTRVADTAKSFVRQLTTSTRTHMLSVLVEGPIGSGKTALAASVGMQSESPYVKLISSENMVGWPESRKLSHIAKVFDDAYKSPLSVVVIDNIERIMEYVAIGPRFSNSILQTLLAVVKKPPPKGRKLMVIGTSSSSAVLKEMELYDCFDATLYLRNLKNSEVRNVLAQTGFFNAEDVDTCASYILQDISIKKLLMLVEMAREGEDKINPERFADCVIDFGLGRI